MTTGPDGKTYPTWHPQVDPTYKCYFDHEHGDDPRTSNANNTLPPFGYIGAQAGDIEPHSGFKVFVANRGMVNNEGRTMLVNSRVVFHMGTGGPKRFTTEFHSIMYDMVAPDGHYVHVQGEADTGQLFNICTRNGTPNRTVVYVQGSCNLSSLYEIWQTRFSIPNVVTVLFAPATFDPITVYNPASPSMTVYTRGAYPQFGSEFHGCNREGYSGPVYWYNKYGQTTYLTDAYGNVGKGNLVQRVSLNSDIGIPFTSDQTQFKEVQNACASGLGLGN